MSDDEQRIDELPAWARNLADLTERSGLTQAELARRAGLSRDSYNRYVRGLTRPPLKSLRALAELFGVKLSDIDPSRSAADTMPDPESMVSRYDASDIDERYRDAHYILSPTASGDPSRTRLRIDVDLSISASARIIEILQEDVLNWMEQKRHTS